MLPRPHTCGPPQQKDHLPPTSTFQRQHTTTNRRSIPISSCSTNIPLSPSTIKVARFPHLFVLGRNIQQFFHHWTGTQACMSESGQNECCQVWALNDQGGKAFRKELLSANTLQVTHHRAHNAAASTYLRASTAKGPPSPDVNIPKTTHDNK